MQSWKPFWISTSAFAIFLFLAAFLLSPWRPEYSWQQSVSYGESRVFHAPAQNPWAELTPTEASQLSAYLHDTPNSLNLTKTPSGTGRENWVYLVEVLRPNKTDVLRRFDEQGPALRRWARVSVVQNSREDVHIADYVVGPLPPSEDTTILPLIYPYNSGRNYIRSPVANSFGVWALALAYNVSDITQDLLGAQINLLNPDDPNGLFVGLRPTVTDLGDMVHWLEFFRVGARSDARSMLPQGLYVKLNTSCNDPDSWTSSEWYYNGRLYPDIDAFRKAWSSPNFTKSKLNLDGPWTDTEDLVSDTRGRSKPPPLSIQPHGARYDLDRKQNYVSWMGFSFYLTTSQHTAVSLFDIRFNDSRLIYSLGLQEAMAHYAGAEPMQAGLEFLDTFFGMGSNMYSLVPGHDCPGYAEYLDMTYYNGDQPVTNENAICLFEFTSDAPLQRHTSDSSVSISRNTYLVLRSVSTVGNYDYTIDYLFYLDGSIEVKVRASGFIFTAFAGDSATNSTAEPPLLPPRAKKNEYGYRIHEAAMTSLHDHVISFRADFDIGGTENTLVRTTIEPITNDYPWDHPEVTGPRNTMHLTHQPITTETGLNWPHNSNSLYLIQSNQTNRWGETKSYRIQPGSGMGTPSHLTILNSTALGKSAAWSASDLWVLRNHAATEPASAHPMNYLEPSHPLVDFAKMVNGESVVDQDLVVYFNLGGHHVPTAADIPNTLMHTSASSVLFSPFNYFDHDVSLHSRQGVRVDRRRSSSLSAENKKKKDCGKDQIRYFGGRYEQGVSLSREELEPDLTGFWRKGQGRMGKNLIAGRGGLWGLFGGWEGPGR